MARKHRKSKGMFKSMNKFHLIAVFFVAVGVITFLSFISLPLAIAAFGAFSAMATVVQERVRRQFWEQAIDFKIKKFSDKHDALTREVMRHKASINDVQADMERKIKAQSISFAALQRETKKASAAKESRHMATPDNDPRLRPLRAVKTQITQPITLKPEESLQNDGAGFSDTVVGELLHHALRDQRVDMFMQPVVRLPQRQRQFYEVFARVRAKAGVYIPAARYHKIANENQMTQDLDTILLVQCLNILRQTLYIKDAPALFMNISETAFTNKDFMSRVLTFLSAHKQIAERLVFELRHGDFINMDMAALRVMSALGKAGVRFSIDHVQSPNIDVRDLQRFNVRFVKVPAKIFLTAKSSDKAKAGAWKFKRQLEGNGIGLIVEKIENEEMMRDLLDFDIHYGQGYLFGRPDVQGAYEPRMRKKRRG